MFLFDYSLGGGQNRNSGRHIYRGIVGKATSRGSGLGGVDPHIEGNDTLQDLFEAGQMLGCGRK